MVFVTALIWGLIGSFHCAGMCGPIALALPLSNSWGLKIGGSLLYSLGRILTYSVLGLLFGLLGWGLKLAGFQQIISVGLGIIMILSVLFPVLFRKKKIADRFFSSFVLKLKSYFGTYFKSNKLISLFIIGLLNGLLPCGLVYTAVAGALETGSVVNGAIFMAAFGLGTSPMMSFISILSSTVSQGFRKIVTKIIPFLIILLGIIFILRGLSLGINYISPKEQMLKPHHKTEHGPPPCCK